MDPALNDLLRELERYGIENDLANTERRRRMLNITRDTGEFLSVLIRATHAQRVLEIGTSNGYSTLWLAEAVRATGGRVSTIEMASDKREMAAKNFERAGLSQVITQLAGDAGSFLAEMAESSVDFVFLDSERPEYPGWWKHLKRILRKGGLLVVDNATSHASEMAPFVEVVLADPEFTSSLVPVGNGEFLATKC